MSEGGKSTTAHDIHLPAHQPSQRRWIDNHCAFGLTEREKKYSSAVGLWGSEPMPGNMSLVIKKCAFIVWTKSEKGRRKPKWNHWNPFLWRAVIFHRKKEATLALCEVKCALVATSVFTADKFTDWPKGNTTNIDHSLTQLWLAGAGPPYST